MKPSTAMEGLLDIMGALRTPGSGCPWDLEQTFESIAPYTIEEAYEVCDAIDRKDPSDLRDELGDLLLQVVFHAQIAKERGLFAFWDVVEAISSKLVRRHPHVFGDRKALDAEDVRAIWDEVKRQEAAVRRGNQDSAESCLKSPRALYGVPLALPALSRADKLTRKAAAVGFHWPEPARVLAKVREELAEVEEALANGTTDEIAEEIGDVLFAVANLARDRGIDPEAALRNTNAKFERRFGSIEDALALTGRSLAEADLGTLEDLWNEAKARERETPSSQLA